MEELIAFAKLTSIFAFGCSFMVALIYFVSYFKLQKKKEKLLILKERTYYPIDTIGMYHGTKVIIHPAPIDETGEQACEGCMAFCSTAMCKAHNFMCDTLVREDGENIILKEIK